MIKRYTVQEAQETILRRRPLGRDSYSPALIERTEALFGVGVTPLDAVRTILAAVEAEGDQALQRWSNLLDGVELDDFAVPPKRMAASSAIRTRLKRAQPGPPS